MNPIYRIQNNIVFPIEYIAAAPQKLVFVVSTKKPEVFNFYNVVSRTLKESIQDIKEARNDARKKFPHMFSSSNI